MTAEQYRVRHEWREVIKEMKDFLVNYFTKYSEESDWFDFVRIEDNSILSPHFFIKFGLLHHMYTIKFHYQKGLEIGKFDNIPLHDLRVFVIEELKKVKEDVDKKTVFNRFLYKKYRDLVEQAGLI